MLYLELEEYHIIITENGLNNFLSVGNRNTFSSILLIGTLLFNLLKFRIYNNNNNNKILIFVIF